MLPAPLDAVALLQTLIPFARLSDEALAALADTVEWLGVPAGVRLFNEGDAPDDGLYGIVSGRVRFFAGVDERTVLTAEAGPGITFGEGSMLLEGGRSRTAVVSRDALLIRLAPAHFQSLMSSSPVVATGVASQLAARFAASPDPAAERAPATIAIDAAVGGDDLEWFLGHLARTLGAQIVPSGTIADEETGGCRILRVDPSDPRAERVLRQADVVVVLRDADRRPHRLEALRSWWSTVDPLAAPRAELVLLRRGGDGRPVGTATWTAAFPFVGHHHVRRGVADDVRRVGRHLGGTAVGLVLGGGGARGMAHIGVLRALAELGIPVDRVGGSSMGAIVGAQAALGQSWEQILEENDRAWNRRALRLDLTLPTVSVSSGRRARRIFDHLVGDVQLEDFLVDFFCTTTNLSRFELVIHREGPASQWIRASASSPGLWPPVVDALGELHIDGGQLNNVPTDVMRRLHRGPIIAVDVCASQAAMTVQPGVEPPVGIRHLLRRRSADRFPSLVDTLNRCALLGSLKQQAQSAGQADVYLTPDLATIGFSGFARMREAAEVGYRVALEELGHVE